MKSSSCKVNQIGTVESASIGYGSRRRGHAVECAMQVGLPMEEAAIEKLRCMAEELANGIQWR